VAKFLGIVVDDKLNFRHHVDELCRRLSSAIGMLNRISSFVPPEVRLNLYYSMIFSRVSYGIVSWGHCSLTGAKKVDRIVSRAQKQIFWSCPVRSRDQHSTMLCYESIFKYFTCIKFYKTIVLGLHPYFSNICATLQPSHEHLTRFSYSNNYNIPSYIKIKCQRSFLYQSITIWNLLPDVIRQARTSHEFKRSLKQHLLNEQVCSR